MTVSATKNNCLSSVEFTENFEEIRRKNDFSLKIQTRFIVFAAGRHDIFEMARTSLLGKSCPIASEIDEKNRIR